MPVTFAFGCVLCTMGLTITWSACSAMQLVQQHLWNVAAAQKTSRPLFAGRAHRTLPSSVPLSGPSCDQWCSPSTDPSKVLLQVSCRGQLRIEHIITAGCCTMLSFAPALDHRTTRSWNECVAALQQCRRLLSASLQRGCSASIPVQIQLRTARRTQGRWPAACFGASSRRGSSACSATSCCTRASLWTGCGNRQKSAVSVIRTSVATPSSRHCEGGYRMRLCLLTDCKL